jgi:hypothetical protein
MCCSLAIAAIAALMLRLRAADGCRDFVAVAGLRSSHQEASSPRLAQSSQYRCHLKHDIPKQRTPAMSNDETPSPTQPGPDASIDDETNEVRHAPGDLGETDEALPAGADQADAQDQAEHKPADTKHRITEKAYKTRDAAVQKAHAAQSTARNAFTGTGAAKRGVPVTAPIAAAVVISIVVLRRR